MQRASQRFYSRHRMHRTFLLHCFRDRRLLLAPKRLGDVLASGAADWIGMTDDERTLRADFHLNELDYEDHETRARLSRRM